jgi:hypothetical protein
MTVTARESVCSGIRAVVFAVIYNSFEVHSTVSETSPTLLFCVSSCLFTLGIADVYPRALVGRKL